MKIAVSADCFSSFTSGFPVRGMMLNLIKIRKEDKFVLFYTKRETPSRLDAFYQDINNLPNVEVRYFKYRRKSVALRRMFQLPLIKETSEFSLFINPGCPEYWSTINVPHICSIADFSTLKGLSTGKYAWFYKTFNKYALYTLFKKIDIIVPISRFTENDLHSFWPQFKNKTHVVLNGIDDVWFNDRFDSCDCNPFVDQPYFIWWGLISRRKNLDNLIEAYKIAKLKNQSIPKLLLVGRFEEYMEYIKNKFDDNIAFIPFQDNYVIKSLVKHSKGLLFPSFYEGFGLPVIEAYSQGVPVACSNVSSLPEIASNKALLFDPYNIEDIAESIIELATLKYDSCEYKEYASNFTYRNAAKAYSIIIDSLI